MYIYHVLFVFDNMTCSLYLYLITQRVFDNTTEKHDRVTSWIISFDHSKLTWQTTFYVSVIYHLSEEILLVKSLLQLLNNGENGHIFNQYITVQRR